MNKKMKLSIILAIFMIVGLILLLYIANGNISGTSNKIILYTILLLMLIAVVLFYVQRKQEKKALSGQYLEAYDEITQAISTSTLSINDKRDAMRQAMEILVDASFEGRKINTVIGNPSEFADNLIQAYGGVKSLITMLLRSFQFILLYAFFLQTITWFMYSRSIGSSFFETQTLLMNHIAYAFIVIFALPLFNIGFGKKHAALYAILAGLIIIGVTAIFILGGDISFLTPLYKDIIVFSNTVSIAIGVISIIMLQMLYKFIGKMR